jgi:threonine-phosphate decarboxylase
MALLKSAHGGNIREAAALLGIAPGELLDFSANINPLGMPASLRQAIVDNPGCAERYPDVEYQQLHQALAAHHQLPAAHILAGNGETESIFTLVHGLKPRRAMIVIPGFAEYRRALQTVDCEVVEYALQERDGWQLTDAILDALTPALDCLFLCTPNNPTGLLPERGLLEAIAQRCRALNISLILDEAFLDFIPDQPGFIPLLAQYPHVWVLRSLTKFYAIPGCVWATCSTLTPGRWRLRERQMPWSINAYAALAGRSFSRTGRISGPPGSGCRRRERVSTRSSGDGRADRVARARQLPVLALRQTRS